MEKEKRIMTSDLPDVEMYHQELLRNIEIRRVRKVKRRSRAVVLLIGEISKDDDNEDREFVENYIKDHGVTWQK